MTSLDRLENIEFWKKLCPKFHINDSQNLLEPKPYSLQSGIIEQLHQDLIANGFFNCGIIPTKDLKPLAICVEVVHRTVGLAVFSLIYDEFWNIIHRLSPLLTTMLGEKYWILPSFWVWFIDPQQNFSGWAPHRDYPENAVQNDGAPKNLTLWMALTDSTIDNSCIYILPGSLDPNYPKIQNIGYRLSNFQDIKALPGPAGTVLGWNGAVLHWGSRVADKTVKPRVSFSFGFQRRDVPHMMPYLINPQKLPSFKQRLGLIGQQIVGYGDHYHPSDRMKEIANKLRGHLPEFKLFI